MPPNRYPPPARSESRPPGFADQLLKSQDVSQFDSNNREFLPHATGNRLVTKEVIWQELELAQLEPTPPGFCDDLVQWTYDEAKKVFLTLIRSGMYARSARTAMRWFYHYEFNDQRLSEQLSPEDQNSIFPNDPWTSFTSHDFLTKFRWVNMSPVFTKERYVYNLHDNAILPFTEKDGKVREGAFSWVHKVSIHPEHTEHEALEVCKTSHSFMNLRSHSDLSPGCHQGNSREQGGRGLENT